MKGRTRGERERAGGWGWGGFVLSAPSPAPFPFLFPLSIIILQYWLLEATPALDAYHERILGQVVSKKKWQIGYWAHHTRKAGIRSLTLSK